MDNDEDMFADIELDKFNSFQSIQIFAFFSLMLFILYTVGYFFLLYCLYKTEKKYVK